MNWKPLGQQKLTNLSAATALTVPSGTRWCAITVEGQDVRLRDDGTAPDATTGLLLKAGQQPWQYLGPPSAILLIQTAAGATVQVSFYGSF